MSKPVPVEVKNGKLRGFVLPESIPAWEQAGWTVVDNGDGGSTKKRSHHRASNTDTSNGGGSVPPVQNDTKN